MKIIDFLNIKKDCPVCKSPLILKVNDNTIESITDQIHLRPKPSYSNFTNISFNYSSFYNYSSTYFTTFPQYTYIPVNLIPIANIHTNLVTDVSYPLSTYEFMKYNCHFQYFRSGYITENTFYGSWELIFGGPIRQTLFMSDYNCSTDDEKSSIYIYKTTQHITIPRIDFFDPNFKFDKFNERVKRLIILS